MSKSKKQISNSVSKSNKQNTIVDLNEFKNWYATETKAFEVLANKVSGLIKELIELKNIKYHSITYRIKDQESLIKKIQLKEYNDPKTQIHDFIGIRIVTFVKSDVDKICEEIEKEFDIDFSNSSNKSDELGEDKVGYRSVHYVANVDELRGSMSDYIYLKDKCFEIQIRTILEHAWADISHDRTYKFTNILPEKNDIRRRFALASASLEMIDREFDRLSKEIEEYSDEIVIETEKGNLSHLIDSTSLLIYLNEKLKDEINQGLIESDFNGGDEILIDELNSLGINKLDQLEKLINHNKNIDYLKSIEVDDDMNFIGLLRHFLMIRYSKEYFEKSWMDYFWYGMTEEDANKLFEFNPSLKEAFEDYGIKIYKKY